MTKEHIKAIGNFIVYYESDLNFIRQFQQFKDGKMMADEYCVECDYSFSRFLSTFGIARNIGKEEKNTALTIAKKWCRGKRPTDVDGLALKIQSAGISHGNLPVSLASKILFLNNPSINFPYDNQAKRTVKYWGKSYDIFSERVVTFEQNNRLILKNCLSKVNDMCKIIEKDFPGLGNFRAIRKNRMLDKLLWVQGGK